MDDMVSSGGSRECQAPEVFLISSKLLLVQNRPMGHNGPYVNNHGRPNRYFQLKKRWTGALKFSAPAEIEKNFDKSV
jgi:hypothetical protein